MRVGDVADEWRPATGTAENAAHRVRGMLAKLTEEEIEFTDYAKHRASFRQIDLTEVTRLLIHPAQLVWAEPQWIRECERFNCSFVLSKHRVLRVIITFENTKLKVINFIKPRKKWQKGTVRIWR